MGWSGGSEIFGQIIKAVKRNVPDKKKRKNIYKAAINAFRDQDWDTEDECEGMDPAFDEVMKKIRKDEGWDDEEELE